MQNLMLKIISFCTGKLLALPLIFFLVNSKREGSKLSVGVKLVASLCCPHNQYTMISSFFFEELITSEQVVVKCLPNFGIS